jgi:GNAT superfamily N-acetyltransferase
MGVDDLDAADRIMRSAFGAIRGLDDPASAFGDADLVRTRFRAAPDAAWVAEGSDGVVGSVFAARWGSFGFFGPLSVDPALWDRGIGSRLLEPVLEAFRRWALRQAGLYTFVDSPRHLGLYRKHGFSPGAQTVITAKSPQGRGSGGYELVSGEPGGPSAALLGEIRRLTGGVFAGLDLDREIVAVHTQAIGDTILLRRAGALDGVAVCHRGAGSEAGGETCYVKFAAARGGDGSAARFEDLIDACEAFTTESGLSRLVAGVNTGCLDAYHRLLARGFAVVQMGISMWLRPDAHRFDSPDDYVINDLR